MNLIANSDNNFSFFYKQLSKNVFCYVLDSIENSLKSRFFKTKNC